LILGGGVPKNYSLQPEPALGQVLGLPNVRGYRFDVQIVTAPVTDGSLSSCPPAEAVTWGKVDKDTYLQTTESMQADYSMAMPFLVKALLDNHAKREGYRLYERREALCGKLREDVRANRDCERRASLTSGDWPVGGAGSQPAPHGALRACAAPCPAFSLR
jgi:deoxyhypusine synthase